MGVLRSGIPVFQLHLYCIAQIFDEGDIDEIYKFLVIHRNFPYPIFLLAIANVVLTTVFLIFCVNANIFLKQKFTHTLL